MELEKYGFVLTWKEFHDAVNLRDTKELKELLSKCPSGQANKITHALNCKTGGFATIHHNKVRNLEVQLLKEACIAGNRWRN